MCSNKFSVLFRVKRITTNSTNPYFILATFWACFFSPFSSFNDEKLCYKYYNKRITTRENGNVQSHDQGESKLNSTINADSGANALTTWLNNEKVHSIRIT